MHYGNGDVPAMLMALSYSPTSPAVTLEGRMAMEVSLLGLISIYYVSMMTIL